MVILYVVPQDLPVKNDPVHPSLVECCLGCMDLVYSSSILFVRNVCILDSHSEIAVPQAGISWYRLYERMPFVILRDSRDCSTKLFRDSPDSSIHVRLCAIRACLLRPASFPGQ